MKDEGASRDSFAALFLQVSYSASSPRGTKPVFYEECLAIHQGNFMKPEVVPLLCLSRGNGSFGLHETMSLNKRNVKEEEDEMEEQEK